MDGGRSQSGVMWKIRQLNVPAKSGTGGRIDNFSFTLQGYLLGVNIQGDDGLAHTSRAHCFQQPVHTFLLVTVSSRVWALETYAIKFWS